MIPSQVKTDNTPKSICIFIVSTWPATNMFSSAYTILYQNYLSRTLLESSFIQNCSPFISYLFFSLIAKQFWSLYFSWYISPSASKLSLLHLLSGHMLEIVLGDPFWKEKIEIRDITIYSAKIARLVTFVTVGHISITFCLCWLRPSHKGAICIKVQAILNGIAVQNRMSSLLHEDNHSILIWQPHKKCSPEMHYLRSMSLRITSLMAI